MGTTIKKQPIQKPDIPKRNNALLNVITPVGLEFTKNGLSIGENIGKIYGLIRYPQKVSVEWLSKITNKIIMIVKSDYRSSLSLVGIGEMFCMSSKYIGRIFLQDTGMKFSEYLMAYRMVQARMLIETTRDKIAVVAGRVGYTQLNNFYVHFKEYYGISPTALRDMKETANGEDHADLQKNFPDTAAGTGDGPGDGLR